MNIKGKIPTLILRAISLLSAVVGVLIAVFALPSFGTAIAEILPVHAFWQYPIVFGLYAAAGCFFYALLRFWFLLNGIDTDRMLLVKDLRAIRVSSIIFSVLYYLSAMPVIFLFAEVDDAPGLVLVGAFIGTFSIGVAAVAMILERNVCGIQEHKQE